MVKSLREKKLFLYYVLYLLLDKVILEISGLPILRVSFINRICLCTFLKMKMLLTNADNKSGLYSCIKIKL